MFASVIERQRDTLILIARVLLMVLFLLSGLQKLMGFSGTVQYLASMGAPMPTLATIIAIVMEIFAAIALILGVCTRPVALLYVVYTLVTALVGHHYWTYEGAEYMANFVNFYKNISIMGGLLLLAVTGAGRYSIDKS